MKVVVLLSGGIDSTTCLAEAVNDYGKENVFALNIHYGQKHHKELQAAEQVAAYYGVKYEVMDLSSIFKFSNCSLLTHSTEEIPEQSYAEQMVSQGNTVSTYVPFRNGIMLSVATAYALSVKANLVMYGAHRDDVAGSAYPDCSPQFTTHMDNAIYYGTGKEVIMISPLIHKNKAQVVEMGLMLNAPYHLTWSCYVGKEKPCGKCGTCIDREKAFQANHKIDPIRIKK